MDPDPYCTTNILDTFAETLGIRYYCVDVIVFIVGVGDAGGTVPGTSVRLCAAIFMGVLGIKSVEGPCGLLIPG